MVSVLRPRQFLLKIHNLPDLHQKPAAIHQHIFLAKYIEKEFCNWIPRVIRFWCFRLNLRNGFANQPIAA